jgi:hypothetical protein
MAQYTNFYETIPESNIRLRGTVILYDGAPYTVLAISDHRKDGVFRIYMEPFGDPNMVSILSREMMKDDNPFFEMGTDHPEFGVWLDRYMDNIEANPDQFSRIKIVRKMMNSPLFNKFRPYPLGLVQTSWNKLVYVERSPTRRTEQGLVDRMLMCFQVNIQNSGDTSSLSNVWATESFRNSIMGIYPTKELAFNIVANGEQHTACAFSRDFAFIAGPAGAVFLVYKKDVVGLLLDDVFNTLRLDKQFAYLRELIEESKLFASARV